MIVDFDQKELLLGTLTPLPIALPDAIFFVCVLEKQLLEIESYLKVI